MQGGDRENLSRAVSAHIDGQSSMGKGPNNLEGGISALKRNTAAFVLNSGQAYSALQSAHRCEITARWR